jgi:hypothetical protein
MDSSHAIQSLDESKHDLTQHDAAHITEWPGRSRRQALALAATQLPEPSPTGARFRHVGSTAPILIASMAWALAQSTPQPDASAVAITAEQRYVQAVAAMRGLENPPFLRFTSAWTSAGMRFSISSDNDRMVLALGSGRGYANAHTYAVAYRHADRMIALTQGTAGSFAGAGADSHFLDPTWAGAYDLLRYGMSGGAHPAASPPAPVPSATASATALRTIGIVSAISAAFYHVEDDGAARCPSGSAGYALKLRALRDPQMHPLTAVTIDAANNRFCSMRFNLNDSGVFGVTGDYELHFAQTAGYWLISDGSIDVAVRFLGISARHVVLNWQNSGVTTPADISAAEFAPPAPAK